MADRVEREIEEILAKLDHETGNGGDAPREPIQFRARRKEPVTSRMSSALPSFHLTPAALLFGGAGIMFIGLIGATFAGPMIWVAFAGVVLFLAAFVWSLTRRTTAGGTGGGRPKGVYWRDRYIEYGPEQPGSIERFKRVFRRR